MLNLFNYWIFNCLGLQWYLNWHKKDLLSKLFKIFTGLKKSLLIQCITYTITNVCTCALVCVCMSSSICAARAEGNPLNHSLICISYKTVPNSPQKCHANFHINLTHALKYPRFPLLLADTYELPPPHPLSLPSFILICYFIYLKIAKLYWII